MFFLMDRWLAGYLWGFFQGLVPRGRTFFLKYELSRVTMLPGGSYSQMYMVQVGQTFLAHPTVLVSFQMT